MLDNMKSIRPSELLFRIKMNFLIAYLLAYQSLAQKVVNVGCMTDTECTSFCCSNNQNYNQKGTCVTSNERCDQRKKSEIIALVITLIVLMMAIGSCALVKVHQEKVKR